MKADLAREQAVWGAFGGASAEGGIHLVGTLPGEAYPVRAVAAVEIAADRTEGELAASLASKVMYAGSSRSTKSVSHNAISVIRHLPSSGFFREGIRSPAAWECGSDCRRPR